MTTRIGDFRATTWQMTLMGLRYLNGRRLRTALTTLAIVFGVALIFAINLVLPSAVDCLQAKPVGDFGRRCERHQRIGRIVCARRSAAAALPLSSTCRP